MLIKQKSTDIALHPLGTKTEHSMQEKQYVLVLFVDIQRAFDSATFVAIQEALEGRSVCKTIIK